MALYKATDKGNILMTADEEAEIRAMWASVKPAPEPKKSLEQRVIDLETAVSILSK